MPLPACSRCVEISTSDQDTRLGKDSRRWNEAAEVGLLVLCCCCSTQHARARARAHNLRTPKPRGRYRYGRRRGRHIPLDTSCYSCPYMTRRLPVPVTGSPRCLSTVCVPAPPVSFYRVCPGSPRCLFTGTVPNYPVNAERVRPFSPAGPTLRWWPRCVLYGCYLEPWPRLPSALSHATPSIMVIISVETFASHQAAALK